MPDFDVVSNFAARHYLSVTPIAAVRPIQPGEHAGLIEPRPPAKSRRANPARRRGVQPPCKALVAAALPGTVPEMAAKEPGCTKVYARRDR
jgi:hypothetical protein